jgi:hypothetical protein
MKFAYLLPFAYFLETRLRRSSISFHAVFEFGAAVVLACAVGREQPVTALSTAAYCYLAFISIYEIGYLVNDLYSARRETSGRHRGPQEAAALWMACWIMVRLIVFLVVSFASGLWKVAGWWVFFGGLCAVFALHNLWSDRELKVATFLWLAWFRFMAPIAFVVEPNEFMGVAFGAGMLYAGFRMFGYLDSKGLLAMPGRHKPQFRTVFFMIPLAAAIPLAQFEHSRGFILLAFYFAASALVGGLVSKLGMGHLLGSLREGKGGQISRKTNKRI